MSDTVNEILEFAGEAASTNMLDQATYDAAAARLAGHTPGIASQALENAALRNLSRFCRGVAQFIAERHAAGVVNDGDADKIVAGLTEAIVSVLNENISLQAATETVAGILKLATLAEAIAGEGGGGITPETLAGALVGAVRAYTAQQYNAPVVRVGASGSQAVDCDLHQLLSITATGAIAFAAPSHLAVGKTVTIMVYAASALAITWGAAYLPSAFALPGSTTAGKWLVMSFMCHKAGALLLTGVAEEA